jgi:ABC-type glycerol-3-phosphate transport system substrate-binding protein
VGQVAWPRGCRLNPRISGNADAPEAFAIPKTSKNKEAAWKFIEFMISKEKDKERALEWELASVHGALY